MKYITGFFAFWYDFIVGDAWEVAAGVVLSLARCIGEFGAVLVVSGGFQSSETAPLRVSNLLQIDFKPDQAYAIAFVLMLVSVLAIVASALLQRRRKAL